MKAFPWLLLAAVAALVLPSSAVLADAPYEVDGFLRSDAPLALTGDLGHQGAEKAVWLHDAPDRPGIEVNLSAANLTVTEVTLEIRSAHTPGPANFTVSHPPEGVTRTTTVTENATLLLEDLGEATDLLFYPSRAGPSLTSLAVENGSASIDLDSDGFQVLDGHRERAPAGQETSRQAFDWSQSFPGPLLTLDGPSSVRLAGTWQGYVWDANATLRNETGTVETYDAGAEIREQNGGTNRYERYTYLLLEADRTRAEVPLEGIASRVAGSAVGVDVEGQAQLPDARGTLSSSEGPLHASGSTATRLAGNLSLAVTPDVQGGGEGLTVSVDGTVRETSLTPADVGAFDDGATVAAAAGGLTVAGLAVAYLASAKGLGLASIPLVGRRARSQPTEAAKPPEDAHVDVDEAGDLLFEPDRFALYHLIRSRPGLTPEACRQTAGVPDAARQLAIMADHGLLAVIGEEPPRYALPGALEDEEAAKVALLREPGAQRVAEVLAVHGLAPQERLLDRLEAAEVPLDRDEAADLLDRFVREGLAYRERGPEEIVVDSTEDLHRLRDRMGETSVPRVS